MEIMMESKKFIDIAKQIITKESHALDLLAETIGEIFFSAVQTIVNNKGRVIVSGIGKSGIIAQKISSTLSSTGTPSYFIHPAEASHGDLGMIHHDDVMIILSNGGESIELFDLVDYAKNADIQIISIVGRKNSTLARSANIVLSLPETEEASNTPAPTTSTTMMLALGDALAVALLEYKKFTIDQYKIFHPGGRIGTQLLKVKDVMCTGSRLPTTFPNTKMSETLIEMTTKSLGCVIIVNEKNEVLGIITDGDLRRHMSENLLEMKSEEVMGKNPYIIDEELKVIEALQIMNKKAITSLIVTKDNKLVGILHIHDCLRIGLDVINNNSDNL
jgi:arabinose-5-phosphate isomerase